MEQTLVDVCIAIRTIKVPEIYRRAEEALEETAVGKEFLFVMHSYNAGTLSLAEAVCRMYEQMHTEV